MPITEPCCMIIDWPISNLEMLAKILTPFLISDKFDFDIHSWLPFPIKISEKFLRFKILNPFLIHILLKSKGYYRHLPLIFL